MITLRRRPPATQPGKVSVPARAFAATEENRTTFGALVDYADAELSGVVPFQHHDADLCLFVCL